MHTRPNSQSRGRSIALESGSHVEQQADKWSTAGEAAGDLARTRPVKSSNVDCSVCRALVPKIDLAFSRPLVKRSRRRETRRRRLITFYDFSLASLHRLVSPPLCVQLCINTYLSSRVAPARQPESISGRKFTSRLDLICDVIRFPRRISHRSWLNEFLHGETVHQCLE